MKSKKIEKIVKRVVTSIRSEEQKERSDMMANSIEEPSMDYMFTESDEQCKKRIRNLVPRLLSLRDQIGKIFMKDTSLFDEIKPKIKEIFDKINQENFNDLYNILMVDNGLSRESNLDEILNDF